jgi:dipeptide/tripeptide permease
VGTVHGVGAMMSMALGGLLVVWAGYDTAFLVLAAIASLGAVLFWLTMSETRGAPALVPTGDAEAKSAA